MCKWFKHIVRKLYNSIVHHNDDISYKHEHPNTGDDAWKQHQLKNLYDNIVMLQLDSEVLEHCMKDIDASILLYLTCNFPHLIFKSVTLNWSKFKSLNSRRSIHRLAYFRNSDIDYGCIIDQYKMSNNISTFYLHAGKQTTTNGWMFSFKLELHNDISTYAVCSPSEKISFDMSSDKFVLNHITTPIHIGDYILIKLSHDNLLIRLTHDWIIKLTCDSQYVGYDDNMTLFDIPPNVKSNIDKLYDGKHYSIIKKILRKYETVHDISNDI